MDPNIHREAAVILNGSRRKEEGESAVEGMIRNEVCREGRDRDVVPESTVRLTFVFVFSFFK
jgi:hypothetical protein